MYSFVAVRVEISLPIKNEKFPQYSVFFTLHAAFDIPLFLCWLKKSKLLIHRQICIQSVISSQFSTSSFLVHTWCLGKNRRFLVGNAEENQKSTAQKNLFLLPHSFTLWNIVLRFSTIFCNPYLTYHSCDPAQQVSWYWGTEMCFQLPLAGTSRTFHEIV